MTEGSVLKSIIKYAIPLILGNFMQQLYNTFDSLIVGNFVGDEALAAVGISGNLSFFLIAFYLGASSGAGILIAQYYGAKKKEEMSQVIHNMLGIGIVLGVVISIIGIIFCPVFLGWMDTPDKIMIEAVLYLRIVFSGMLFQVLYNMMAAILNAVGNSRKSLQFLMISSIVNIILDLVFVKVFQWGIAGAAFATVISQFVCCILILNFLRRINTDYSVKIKDIGLNAEYVVKIIKIGLPAAIQNAVIGFSNLLIVSGINDYGEKAATGFASYMKVDGFDILPILSFSLAATTFVGQNVGAGKLARARKGALYIIVINVIYTLLMTLVMLCFDRQIISAFSRNETVIHYGVMCIWTLAPFYVLLGVIHSLAGVVRGTGDTVGPMIIIFFSLCIYRVFWVSIAAPKFSSMKGVLLSYPTSFIVGSVLMTIYTLYRYIGKGMLRENRIEL